MRRALRRLWVSLNYRYAMSERYLAYQRGEYFHASEWHAIAIEWQRELA